MLRNAVGSGRVSHFPEKSVTKMYGSTLLAFREGWVGIKFPEKMCYVTLDWPQNGANCLVEQSETDY